MFHFAAFDEAWKVGAEGDVGAFWGLWDKDARPKFCDRKTWHCTRRHHLPRQRDLLLRLPRGPEP